MLTRRTLLTTLPVAVLLSGCTDSPDATDAANALRLPAADVGMGVEEFAGVVAQPETVVIDVRTAEEYAGGHLEGARNLDVSAPDFAEALDGLDPTASYAVYCRTGVRSAAALEIMREQGFTSLAHLAGGIGTWTGSGRPVVDAQD